MASLLSSLTDLVTPDLRRQLSTSLGESEDHVGRGVTAGFGSILAGLASRADDTSFLGRLFDLLPGDDDAARLADPSHLFSGATTGTPGPDHGSAFLSMLTGGQEERLADGVAQSAGMGAGTARRLLGMLAPMALGVLTRRIRQGGLNAASFGEMLRGERSEIMDAAPSGIAGLLGLGGTAAAASAATASAATTAAPMAPPTVTTPHAEPARTAHATTTTHAEPARTAPAAAPPPEDRGSPTWLWPLLGLLALGALGWALTRGGDDDVSTAGDTTTIVADDDRTAMATNGATDGATDGDGVSTAGEFAETDTTFGNLGASVARALPGGVSLNVPENGIESQVIAFIGDDGRPVDETTWFNFDRLLFATGSATLEPQSQEQLRNVAQIMAAYPDVNIKIGGYTDNTGDADANVRLSQQRADAVMRELTTLGVAAGRMEAEGYGAQFPVASNDTEEGRQQNRRIAMRVTQK